MMQIAAQTPYIFITSSLPFPFPFPCQPPKAQGSSKKSPITTNLFAPPLRRHTTLNSVSLKPHIILKEEEDEQASSTTKTKQDCYSQDNSRRNCLTLLLVSSSFLLFLDNKATAAKTKTKSPYDERRLLEQNKKIQEANNAPTDFPSFVRQGFQVKVVISDTYIKRDSGLIYLDIKVGEGDSPKDGQQVTFHYVGYNESGRRIDSTYLQGSPAKIRLGNNALVPGFEEGIRDMKPGGKRRLIIPPELGPPVGPSTFFSSKQFEVFDVELLDVKSCERRTIGFYSDVVCS